MKKFRNILLTCVAVLGTSMLIAQAKSVSTIIDNQIRNAIMIEINQPVNITTDALQQKLQRAGLNEKSIKGSGSYMGVVLSEISKKHIDLYTNVEARPNNTSVLFMAVSKSYSSVNNRIEDSLITQNVMRFLNSFVQDVNIHFGNADIVKLINKQQKPETDYQKLLDEQADLQNKKQQIDNRLIILQTEIDTHRIELDKKKNDIEDAKARRSKDNNQ